MREKICGIYSYRDLREGYKIVYIGQSRDIYHRHRSHCRDKKTNQPIDKIILEDPKRYCLYIEEICKEHELNQLEAQYIEEYNPKYNCTKGGDYVHHKHIKGNKSQYTMWDSKKTYYISHKNQKRNRPFRVYRDGAYLSMYVEDWFTVNIIHELIDWGLKNEIE